VTGVKDIIENYFPEVEKILPNANIVPTADYQSIIRITVTYVL